MTKIKVNQFEEFDTYYKGWDTKHENSFLVSKEDYEVVRNFCWYKINNGYWGANLRDGTNKSIRLHQLIMKQLNKTYSPSRYIVPDHINRNRSDNRRENLRLVPLEKNATNRGETIKKTLFNKETKGKEKFIHLNKKTNKYIVDIRVRGERTTYTCSTLEEAIEKRDKKIDKIKGVI